MIPPIDSSRNISELHTDISMPQRPNRSPSTTHDEIYFRASDQRSFLGYIWDSVVNCFKSLLGRFFPSSNDQLSLALANKINFGKNFIENCLRNDRNSPLVNPPCKIAIVAKLNERVVSQHLVTSGPTLEASAQTAKNQVAFDLDYYEHDHGMAPSDFLKIDVYFLKQNPNGLYDCEYRYASQNSGSGHDHCPRLSQAQITQYFIAKYGPESSHRSDFLRFMH